MKNVIFAVAMILLLAAAKATTGQDFNAENLPRLEIGKTTLQEATTLLGAPPAQSVVGASGATGYTWQYIESKASLWTGKAASSSKRVVLVFGTDGAFQRIFQMDGVQLTPEDHERLFTRPASEHAGNTQQTAGRQRPTM